MTTYLQNLKSWSANAVPVIGRALAVSILLGTVLTGVNQTDALLGNAEFQLLPLALVFLTPLIVVAVSQILGMRAARRAISLTPSAQKGLLSTIFSQGIPMRAIIVGLTAALVNSAIMIADLIDSKQSLSQLPLPLMLQSLTLPIIFGALSQAISFRRTLNAMSKAKSV